MNRLVVVAPLRPGGEARARELLDEGPPFDLEGSPYESHEVFVTPTEVVFLFEGTATEGATLKFAAEDPGIWRAAKAWAECLEGRPRIARSAFSWKRETASG
jgi:hypothetical protein